MSFHRYQASGYMRDDIVISKVHRTITAARDCFFESYPNLPYCIVKRVRVTLAGDVRSDTTFKPKRFSKISA